MWNELPEEVADAVTVTKFKSRLDSTINILVLATNQKLNWMDTKSSQGIDYKKREVMVELYRILVRPQLEYCVQFYCRKDVVALERVQSRFTRMMEQFSYEERLDRLGLFSLEQGRLRDNLTEAYWTGW
eukprot:g32174.t1